VNPLLVGAAIFGVALVLVIIAGVAEWWSER
jgi:formate/nitrite transporter FocA (FNT family)